MAGAPGGLLEALTFVAVRPRLPAEVPSHYGAFGQVTASLPPLTFLVTGLAIQVAATAVLALVLLLTLRNGVIEHQHGPGFGPAVGLVLSAVAIVVSGPTTLLLLPDAGLVSAGGETALIAGVAFLIVPLMVLVAVFGSRPRPTPAPNSAPQFECSSCGATFSAPTLRWVLGPHVGGSGYLTCSVCGERGWDRRVGTPYFPSGPSRDDEPRPN